jgi:4-amino-4-deoxy-L-arabinose transferase-like glycosyltransferase
VTGAEPAVRTTPFADRRHLTFRLELLAVCLLALGVRLAALHHPHFYDELYHVLAAKSLLATGRPTIASGDPYTRAQGFTYLVAGVFQMAGVGMTQLRSVSLVAGTLTVALLFGWLYRAAGRATAWIAAVLLALDPEAVAYSTAGRFYAVQSLFFLVAVASVWWATLPERAVRSRIVALSAAAVALAAATHLQVATLLGASLLALWAALTMAFTDASGRRRRRWIAIIGLVLVGIVVVAWLGGAVAWAERMSAFVPAWAAEDRSEIRFYYWAMLLDYPLLVTLLPVLVVLALGRWPREATLCTLVAGGVLVYHTLAAFKGTRFVLYAKPLWFGVSAMGIAVLAPYVWQRTQEALERLAPAMSAVARCHASRIASAIMLLFALLATPAFRRVRQLVQASGTDPWADAAGELRRLAAESDVVVGGARLPLVYFVGRLDVVLERPDAGDPDRELDGWDSQVGRPVVATIPAFEALVARYPRGLVVSDTIHWRKRWAVRDSLADYIERTLPRVPLRDSLFLVFRWAHAPGALVRSR